MKNFRFPIWQNPFLSTLLEPSTAQIDAPPNNDPRNWHEVITFGCGPIRGFRASADESFLGVVLSIDAHAMNDPGKFDNGLAKQWGERIKNDSFLRRWIGVEIKLRKAVPLPRLGARP